MRKNLIFLVYWYIMCNDVIKSIGNIPTYKPKNLYKSFTIKKIRAMKDYCKYLQLKSAM